MLPRVGLWKERDNQQKQIRRMSCIGNKSDLKDIQQTIHYSLQIFLLATAYKHSFQHDSSQTPEIQFKFTFPPIISKVFLIPFRILFHFTIQAPISAIDQKPIPPHGECQS